MGLRMDGRPFIWEWNGKYRAPLTDAERVAATMSLRPTESVGRQAANVILTVIIALAPVIIAVAIAWR